MHDNNKNRGLIGSHTIRIVTLFTMIMKRYKLRTNRTQNFNASPKVDAFSIETYASLELSRRRWVL